MIVSYSSLGVKTLAIASAGMFFTSVSNAQIKHDSIKSEQPIQIEEIIVTGTRFETDVRNLPMSISVVTQKQLIERQAQSIFPVLNEQVPGLFITSKGVMGYGVSAVAAGTMRLRGIGGAPTTGLLMLIDGEPQYMGIMGHPVADVFQTIMADRIEVVRGPASVLYGSNAMGGVINVVTHRPTKDTVQTNARFSYGSYNSMESSVSNLLKKGRFNSKMAVSYNQTDGHRDNMEFDQISGNAVLGYRMSEQWNVNTNLNLSHFNSSNPGTITNPIIDNDASITRGMTVFSVENSYEKTSGALRLYYNWGHHEINDGYSIGNQPRDYLFVSDDQMTGLSWYQSATLLPNNRITLGLDYQRFGGEANNESNNNTTTSVVDTTLYEAAGYVTVRQALGTLMTLDAGVRYDYHSQTGFHWIPQLGLSAHLPHAIEAKAMVSEGFRNPTIREFFMFPPQNPNLLPEKIINYELSVSQKTSNNQLSYNLTLFYINGDNMIQTVVTNGRGMNINTGEVKNHGIEVSLNYMVNQHWAANANYSWLHMEHPVVAAPEHKTFLGIDYSRNKLKASTGIQYVGRLYTSIAPPELQDFCLWNLRGSYQISKLINVFVAGENLFNQSYEIIDGFPMPQANALIGFNLHL